MLERDKKLFKTHGELGDRGGGQGYSELRGVGVVKKRKIDFQIRVRGYLDFGG